MQGQSRRSKPNRASLVGKQGEDAAACFLQQRGYRILERNWRPQGVQQGLELDIIAEKGGSLVFVEVKTRMYSGKESFSPLASFTHHKQQKMVRAAREFLAARQWWEKSCRFDVMSIILEDSEKIRLEHFEHVIEIGHSMDSGNAAWQPW